MYLHFLSTLRWHRQINVSSRKIRTHSSYVSNSILLLMSWRCPRARASAVVVMLSHNLLVSVPEYMVIRSFFQVGNGYRLQRFLTEWCEFDMHIAGSGLILGLHPASERRRYFIMSSDWLGASLESALRILKSPRPCETCMQQWTGSVFVIAYVLAYRLFCAKPLSETILTVKNCIWRCRLQNLGLFI